MTWTLGDLHQYWSKQQQNLEPHQEPSDLIMQAFGYSTPLCQSTRPRKHNNSKK